MLYFLISEHCQLQNMRENTSLSRNQASEMTQRLIVRVPFLFQTCGRFNNGFDDAFILNKYFPQTIPVEILKEDVFFNYSGLDQKCVIFQLMVFVLLLQYYSHVLFRRPLIYESVFSAACSLLI